MPFTGVRPEFTHLWTSQEQYQSRECCWALHWAAAQAVEQHALDAIMHVEQLGTRELVFDVATSSNVDFDYPCSADSGYNRLTDLERRVIDQVVVCAESLHLLQQQLPRHSFRIAVDEVFEATLLGQRDGHRLANRPHGWVGCLCEIGKLYRADGSGTGCLCLPLQILGDLRYQDLFSLCNQCIHVRRGYYLMAGKEDTHFTCGLPRLGAGFGAAQCLGRNRLCARVNMLLKRLCFDLKNLTDKLGLRAKMNAGR